MYDDIIAKGAYILRVFQFSGKRFVVDDDDDDDEDAMLFDDNNRLVTLYPADCHSFVDNIIVAAAADSNDFYYTFFEFCLNIWKDIEKKCMIAMQISNHDAASVHVSSMQLKLLLKVLQIHNADSDRQQFAHITSKLIHSMFIRLVSLPRLWQWLLNSSSSNDDHSPPPPPPSICTDSMEFVSSAISRVLSLIDTQCLIDIIINDEENYDDDEDHRLLATFMQLINNDNDQYCRSIWKTVITSVLFRSHRLDHRRKDLILKISLIRDYYTLFDIDFVYNYINKYIIDVLKEDYNDDDDNIIASYMPELMYTLPNDDKSSKLNNYVNSELLMIQDDDDDDYTMQLRQLAEHSHGNHLVKMSDFLIDWLLKNNYSASSLEFKKLFTYIKHHRRIKGGDKFMSHLIAFSRLKLNTITGLHLLQASIQLIDTYIQIKLQYRREIIRHNWVTMMEIYFNDVHNDDIDRCVSGRFHNFLSTCQSFGQSYRPDTFPQLIQMQLPPPAV